MDANHFDWLLNQLPTKVDTLICEGTTLSREDHQNRTETDLEDQAVELFKKYSGPVFVLQSSMNIDRIVTMYRAAQKTRRWMLQDLYMAEITNSVGGSIPNPNGFDTVKTFVTKSYDPEHFRYKLFNKYGPNKIGIKQIAKASFVMCVRTSMLGYLQSLNNRMAFNDGLLVYSFWRATKNSPKWKNSLNAARTWGWT